MVLAAPAVLGAAAPLFAALFATLLHAEPVQRRQWVGMGLGLCGVVCTAGAFVLFYSLVARLGPTRAQVISLLVSLYAMGWGWLVLDEQPTLAMAAACAAVLMGVCLCLVTHRVTGPPRV